MSRPAIEARSLSSLTSLASNPPPYPRNPTHGKQEPLVLYIARVPGSRDVFLSPMKPREKVVTAEDVQNSLYFVHMNNPEDDRFMSVSSVHQETNQEQQPMVSSNYTQVPAIPRKAVPNASAPTGALPPRQPTAVTLNPLNNYGGGQNAAAANNSHLNSNYLAPEYVPRRSLDSSQYQKENERPFSSARRHSEQVRSMGTSLTLIRRDPSSGAQWNIGRIDDPSMPDISSSGFSDGSNKRPIGAPLYIDITNPGYSKFLHSEQNSIPPDVQERLHENANVFRRRLWMEGVGILTGGFGHQRLNSHDSGVSTRSPRHSSEISSDHRVSTTTPFPGQESQPQNTNQIPGSQTGFRGYVFMSPWGGRCEFITGAGGGSLKCQHVVPGLQGAPPVALIVSELRFNLPSTAKVSTSKGDDSLKKPSFFHRSRHHRHASDVSGDTTHGGKGAFDRMDLSLGQEYAGGGFGGKDAKLGKLIIEDEGLKMVDLLVAANVALWWRAYDKYETRIKTNRVSFS
ncbi:unnamed protein product [Periconia digitata]|uniref:Uncharacterized protein n=1 Tax=Periconia digitata TaxID=1303443 RepID=A0A9W4UGM8_9PLEO|nr:unnamed protein product [Periconia digitata]